MRLRFQHLLPGLAGVELELPAPVGVLGAHVGGQPVRVAHLHGVAVQRVVGVGDDVHHQPVVVVAEIMPAAADAAAHEARCAVAADQVAGGKPEGFAGTQVPSVNDHPVARIADGRGLGADVGGDVRFGQRGIAQKALQFGLVEHVEALPAVAVERRGHLLEEQLPLGVAEADVFPGAQGLQQAVDRLAQAKPLEAADDLAIQGHRPGQLVHGFIPFNDRHRQPGAGQEQGGGCADRPHADDGDVEIGGCPCGLLLARHALCSRVIGLSY